MNRNTMTLKVMEPEQILIEQEVEKVIAEGTMGSFCLKPNHIDYVSALKSGILLYQADGKKNYVAVNEGILVKYGGRVLVSVLNAIKGTGPEPLAGLEQAVREKFHKTEALAKAAEIALKSMEADLLLHFIELEKRR
ncbi:F0F1 ATP synthase subunit epsilon [Fodinibius salsisoli]|uniref:ATP synthase epsilon chain n=1 Tax=Fodinibius salsisoli TaxID=2820877 RepID=A0ABT3PIW0_9BACT|nr:F0F1 ATP synthase subunit epsilon [Fodinibius salsisoli]MCW9705852.1 hypothetical protein [Fodinibius salsisoli]